jgi:hypothetical protein
MPDKPCSRLSQTFSVSRPSLAAHPVRRVLTVRRVHGKEEALSSESSWVSSGSSSSGCSPPGGSPAHLRGAGPVGDADRPLTANDRDAAVTLHATPARRAASYGARVVANVVPIQSMTARPCRAGSTVSGMHTEADETSAHLSHRATAHSSLRRGQGPARSSTPAGHYAHAPAPQAYQAAAYASVPRYSVAATEARIEARHGRNL